MLHRCIVSVGVDRLRVFGGCVLALGALFVGTGALAAPVTQVTIASQLADINPGSGSSFPSNLTSVNGRLFFTANNGTNGYQLWSSDGTRAGTMKVASLLQGSATTFLFSLTNVNGRLFFMVVDATNTYALWTSDGTQSGIVKVADVILGDAIYRAATPELVAVNDTLFFRATDSTSGYELWKTTLINTIPQQYLPLLARNASVFQT